MFPDLLRIVFAADGAPGAPAPGPAPASAASPAPPAAPPSAPWWTGKVDEVTSGYMKNRGWDTMTPEELALQAMKSHQEAQKFIGAPAHQLVRLPEDPNDTAGWAAVRQRLGAGQKVEDYDLSSVKFANGEDLDAGFIDAFRAAAFQHGLPKTAATEIARSVVKFLDGVESGQAAETAAAQQAERAVLEKNWGPNWDANMVKAREAARALGITEVEINGLESVVGYARVMEMLRGIANRIGEGRFVDNPALGPGNGVMSRDQAIARKEELMRDREWAKRYMAGGAAEGREMTALLTLIVGDDTAATRGRIGR